MVPVAAEPGDAVHLPGEPVIDVADRVADELFGATKRDSRSQGRKADSDRGRRDREVDRVIQVPCIGRLHSHLAIPLPSAAGRVVDGRRGWCGVGNGVPGGGGERTSDSAALIIKDRPGHCRIWLESGRGKGHGAINGD